MGYTTDFTGKFSCTPKLNENQIQYLNDFSETRRMKRDSKIAETFEDKVRKNVNLPIGIEGEYFVGSIENSIKEYLPNAKFTTHEEAWYNG